METGEQGELSSAKVQAEQERQLHKRNREAFMASVEGQELLKEMVARERAAEKAQVEPTTPAAPQAGSSVAAAVDPVLVQSIATAFGQVLQSHLGERRRDELVPSEQGVTCAQYAQARACIQNVNFTPPDKWSDSEGARDRDVKFLQGLRFCLRSLACQELCGVSLRVTSRLQVLPRSGIVKLSICSERLALL